MSSVFDITMLRRPQTLTLFLLAMRFADLAVVDRDPFTSTPGDLRSMPVAATMLGGRFTHSAL